MQEVTALTKKDMNFETNTLFVLSGKSRAAKGYLDMTSETKQIMER